MTALFVTGTGTDVGKTFVAASIVRQLRTRGLAARAFKPVISGYDPAVADQSDSAVLLDAAGELATPEMIAAISPWRFAAPLAPNMAARREGKHVDFAAVVAFCRDAIATAQGPVLIEGVGGVMSPISDEETVLDWIAVLGIPAVLVCGSYLGAISHALTALLALERRAIKVPAIFVSESPKGIDLDETCASLRRITVVPVIGVRRSTEQIGLDQVPDLDALLR